MEITVAVPRPSIDIMTRISPMSIEIPVFLFDIFQCEL